MGGVAKLGVVGRVAVVEGGQIQRLVSLSIAGDRVPREPEQAHGISATVPIETCS